MTDQTLANTAFEAADAAISQRLLDQHDVVVDAFGNSLFLFPCELSKARLQVLESGTADGEAVVLNSIVTLTVCTGHWLHRLSLQAPNLASNLYVGTDINPKYFPKSHGASFQFYQHNVADPWPDSEHGKYDIVHQRLSLPGAAPAQLSSAVEYLFALVKPGGWIQLVEAEQTGPNSGPVFEEFLDLVKLVFDTTGAGWNYARNMRSWLEASGAVDIGEVSVDMAFGAAHKDPDLAEKGATCTAGAVAGLVMYVGSKYIQSAVE
jgi:hypothetical protein